MSRPRIDFLQSRRQPLVGWCLLLLGAAALAAVLWTAQRLAMESTAREDRAQRTELAQEQERRSTERSKLPPSVEDRRLKLAGDQLRRPWLSTLRAIEGVTTDPIYLLTMSVDSTSGHIKLEAEAPSFDHALVYVQQLGQDGSLTPAVLASYEPATGTAAGRQAIRFTATTQWRRP